MENKVDWQPYSFELPMTTSDLGDELYMPFHKTTFLFFSFVMTPLLLYCLAVLLYVIVRAGFDWSDTITWLLLSILALSLGAVSIGLKLLCLHLVRTFSTHTITISKLEVTVQRTNSFGDRHWSEVLENYTSVQIVKYSSPVARGVKLFRGWGIFLDHPNKERRVCLFWPTNSRTRDFKDERARSIASSFAELFSLPVTEVMR